MVRRIGELRADGRVEDEVAERAAATPALIPRLGDDTARPRIRPQLGPALEPLDPPEAVPFPSRRLGGLEVIEEDAHGVLVEAEHRVTGPRLGRRQAAASS